MTNEHEGDLVRVSPGAVRAICSCGWSETFESMQDSAISFGRHVATTLPPIPEVQPS